MCGDVERGRGRRGRGHGRRAAAADVLVLFAGLARRVFAEYARYGERRVRRGRLDRRLAAVRVAGAVGRGRAAVVAALVVVVVAGDVDPRALGHGVVGGGVVGVQ